MAGLAVKFSPFTLVFNLHGWNIALVEIKATQAYQALFLLMTMQEIPGYFFL